MSKYFKSFADDAQWDRAPNWTAQRSPLQKRYLALSSGTPITFPSMPPAGSHGSPSYLVDQQCANPEDCQQVIRQTISQHGTCYVRITGNPAQPRLTIWKATA